MTLPARPSAPFGSARALILYQHRIIDTNYPSSAFERLLFCRGYNQKSEMSTGHFRKSKIVRAGRDHNNLLHTTCFNCAARS